MRHGHGIPGRRTSLATRCTSPASTQWSSASGGAPPALYDGFPGISPRRSRDEERSFRIRAPWGSASSCSADCRSTVGRAGPPFERQPCLEPRGVY